MEPCLLKIVDVSEFSKDKHCKIYAIATKINSLKIIILLFCRYLSMDFNFFLEKLNAFLNFVDAKGVNILLKWLLLYICFDGQQNEVT